MISQRDMMGGRGVPASYAVRSMLVGRLSTAAGSRRRRGWKRRQAAADERHDDQKDHNCGQEPAHTRSSLGADTGYAR